MRMPLVGLILVAVAFGVVEAAVVTYLRLWLDPQGTLFPLVQLPPDLLGIEMARELATLVLLATVALLAVRGRPARFAAFMVLFGVWDLVYYGALRFTMHWPQGLRTWDLLFLLPVRWLGPVYAPMLVAATMIVAGTMALEHERRRGRFRVRARHAAAAALGAAFVISSFVLPAESVPPGSVPMPHPSDVVLRDAAVWSAPRFPIERLLLGEAIAIAAFADAWRRNRAFQTQ